MGLTKKKQHTKVMKLSCMAGNIYTFWKELILIDGLVIGMNH